MTDSQRRDIVRMLAASVCFGAVGGIFNSSLSNFLADVHHFDTEMRGWLEFPRELPGFVIVVVVGALVMRFRETRILALAGADHRGRRAGRGAPLAEHGAGGAVDLRLVPRRPHQLHAGGPGGPEARGARAARDDASASSAPPPTSASWSGRARWCCWRRSSATSYALFYSLGAVFALVAAWLFTRLQVDRGQAPSRRLVFRREYGIFYAISALFGIRKQVFYVFGTWVLVQLHGVSVSTIAHAVLHRRRRSAWCCGRCWAT